MDRDNKYYSLIKNLIMNHRKFPGCEAILDEIIDDVFAHSKTVIDSIDNEDIIQSYIQKVVSTSVITVPRRLNFHSEINHRVIGTNVNTTAQSALDNNITNKEIETIETVNPENIESSELITEQPQIDELTDADDILKEELYSDETPENTNLIAEESIDDNLLHEEPQKTNTEFVDKMINSIEVDSIIDIPQKADFEVVEEEADISTDNLEESNDNDFLNAEDETQYEEIDNSLVWNINDSMNSELENSEELNTETTTINDNTIISDTQQLEAQEELIFENNSNIDENIEELNIQDDNNDNDLNLCEEESALQVNDEINNIDELPEETETLALKTNDENIIIDEIQPTEDNSLDNKVELEVAETDLDVDNAEDLDLIENKSEDVISELEPAEGFLGTYSEEYDMPIQDIEETGNSDLDFINESSEEQDDIFDMTLNLEENDSSLEPIDTDPSENLLIEEDNNFLTEEPIEKTEPQEERSCKKIDYSPFDYTPVNKENESDKDVILDKLIKLNNHKPDLNILKVFDLKYKQNLTIDVIATELQMDSQKVITALDNIVELV